MAERLRKIGICADCGRERPIKAFGLCRCCCMRKRRREHPDENAATMKRYHERHPGANVEANRRSRAANPDTKPAIDAIRRAKQRAVVVERVLRSEVLRRASGLCWKCGKPITEKRWHLHHIRPLADGGEHSYRNCAPTHEACHNGFYPHWDGKSGYPEVQ